MAANTAPIFIKSANLGNDNGTGMNQLVTAAANDYTGIDADVSVIFTAGADGSFVEKIRFKPGGTNASATVARIYLNNGADKTVATNNTFIGEQTLPATTAIATAATQEIDYPIGMAIPAGWRLMFGLGTAVAGGWAGFAWGGGNY